MEKRELNWEKLNERIGQEFFSIFCLKMQNVTLYLTLGSEKENSQNRGRWVKTDSLEKIVSRNENSWKTMC